MTYFTDSVYEKMMVQKPIYGREKTSPAPNDKKSEKRDKTNNEPIPNLEERSVKE